MAWSTVFKCMECGQEADILTTRKFRCGCGGLYDVYYPPSRHGQRHWAELFDSRGLSPHYPSEVWRYKPWVLNDLPDEHIVSLGEGCVPIVRAGNNLSQWLGGKVEAWIVAEGKNPTGAFKDRGMTVLMSVAKAAGIEEVMGASTGDTSASASAYAAKARIRCTVLLPQGQVTAFQVLQLKMAGAITIMLPGSFDDCMKVVDELVSAGRVYPINSMNPCRIQGHMTLVYQVAAFFGWQWANWFVAPVGNGSNVSSIGLALSQMDREGFVDAAKTHILGCQSVAANPLTTAWVEAGGLQATRESWERVYRTMQVGETFATAMRIGAPVSWKKVMRSIIGSHGAMAEATDAEAREAIEACAHDGLFVCPQSGVAFAGAKLALASGVIPKGSRIVFVSTADGSKFTGSFIDGVMDAVIMADDCRTSTVERLIGLA